MTSARRQSNAATSRWRLAAGILSAKPEVPVPSTTANLESSSLSHHTTLLKELLHELPMDSEVGSFVVHFCFPFDTTQFIRFLPCGT
jgi:hypothetical protein